MQAQRNPGSRKLFLILILLIGGLTASAITFADSIFSPLGLVSEGSFFSKLNTVVPIVSASKPEPVKIATLPGLTTTSSSGTSPALRSILQTAVDVQGADDEPGQKDLNALSVDYGDPGATEIDVTWNWDDTSTSGTNTRDGGALFDTDGDGNANFVFYITVAPDNSWVNRVFICTADAKPDRCTGPTLAGSFTSTSTVSVQPNTDPFGPGGSHAVASHSSGNTCRTRPGCYTADTRAVTDLKLSDFGNTANTTIKLLNVCSYPSGEPNSDPSDCVLAISPGSLTLVKVVNNLGYEGPGLLGVSSFPLSIDGNPTTSGNQVSVLTGNHTISEGLVANYDSGQWICPGATVTSTVNRTATVTVASGANVTCTMTNTLQQSFVNEHLTITKVDDGDTYDSVGDVIDYTINATNTGNVTLHNVVITDPNATNLVCTPTTPVANLVVGGIITCTARHTVTQADLNAGSYLNAACADDGNGNGTTGADQACDDVTTPGTRSPSLSIVKGDNDATYDSVGDVITYSIVATNTGNVTLAAVTVTDALATLGTCTPANGSSLAPGATMTCSATHTVTQADIDAGSYLNTACVNDGPNGAAQVCDDENTPAGQSPALSIVKGDNDATYDSAGDTITYSITATNTGNVTLHNVTITDPNAVLGTCTPTIPVANLAPGATITCSATHTVTQADVDAGSYLNTACVDDGAGGATQACDDETTPAVQSPALSIVKGDNDATYDSAGDVITYSIVATNTGNTTLAAVTVTDALATLGTCTPANGSSLAPGATMTCSATYTVTQADVDAGSYLNTACVNDGPGGAAQACDDETTPAVQSPALSIVKDDNGATYDSVGDVITYSITATNTGNVTLAAVTITDAFATLGTCTPANGSSLAPGATMTCSATHTITQADIDAGSYLNTACVDDGAGGASQACDDETTPAGQSPALSLVKTARIKVITYSFVITNVGNTTLSTIGLTDPLFISDDNPTGLLSGCSTQSLAPGASTDCEADYTVTAEDYANGFVTNIATATAAGGVITTATVTITPLTVVSPTPTPTP